MNYESLNNLLLKKLQKPDQEGLKGSRLSFHIPVQTELINYFLETLVTTSENMKDFETIVLQELDENEFLVTIDHKRINKTIRCRLHDFSYNSRSEALVIIEFLEGIHFYEKIALKSATAFKKGWNWFKGKLPDGAKTDEKTKSAVNFSSSRLTINLPELLRQQGMDYLNPFVEWKSLTTDENKLIIDFSIKI